MVRNLPFFSQQVDLVLDTVGGEKGDRLLNVLKPFGSLVPTVWGSYSKARAADNSLTVYDVSLQSIKSENLNELSRLIDAGQLHVVIDTVVPLQDTRKAHELSESRRARGKIIVQVI